MQIIDGKSIAKKIKDNLKLEVEALKKKGITPAISVILVGNNPASQIYVKNKIKACGEVGIKAHLYEVPETASQDEVSNIIKKLNGDTNIHAILLQLPLPKKIKESDVIGLIDTAKDVDGLTPLNTGRLIAGIASFKPCTAQAVIELIDSTDFPIEGSQAVVIGRSMIVGKPVSLLLLQRSATVTICHSKTKNLPELIGRADIVVAALGSPKLIKGAWIKNGAVVIDVGINRLPDGRLVGDVEFDEASKRAFAITPVPGGVGPMTIAMLIKNTVEAARKK